MKTANLRRHRGFTLVEMLVVIAIIGILAAILIPTLYRVVIKARQNVIAQELNQLHLAIESYKQKFGDYPPDFTTLTLITDFNNSPPHLVVRHIRKAFPRHAYTPGSTGTLAACFKNTSGTFNQPDPAEALVLWLSQLREDPRLPLSGTGNKIVLFPFDEKRLVDPDSDGLYSYLPPSGKDAPYVYFDSRIYTDNTNIPSTTTPVASLCVYKDSAGTAVLYPYASKLNATAVLSMANKTTYQLISAGLDGEYGDVSGVTAGTASTYKVFPFGTNYKSGDMDNIANFSDGKIFEDLLE
jgi:prepilin-type N-terminal cleavage/methylation domain-containing protein